MNTFSKNSLIITLKIDDDAQHFFNEKRRQYYPAYANFVEAHITLFHKLPSDDSVVNSTLQEISKISIFDMEITGIKNIKNFVAYEITSPTLQHIHAKMQAIFIKMLHQKDRMILYPHITIQNKATAYKAFKTHQKLMETFTPFTISATGIYTWLYTKKQWLKMESYFFEK